MTLFLRFTAIYVLFGMGFVVVFRASPLALILDMAADVSAVTLMFFDQGVWPLAVFCALFFFLPRGELLRRIPLALAGLMGCSLFFLTFTMVKTSLPSAVPFWADGVLGHVDRAMHFGVDPWVITHAMLPDWPGNSFQVYYIGLWIMPALFFPVLLALFDGDEARVRKYVILYIWAWVGVGTLFAMALMSGGPIYHQHLTGSDMFAPLYETLATSGITDSVVGATQSMLWAAYASGGQNLGSGISAFPSVHVAVASVIGLYVIDRWRIALIPMVVMIAGYQILSVHLGWHYAIDGYFSILTVLALRAVLTRHAVKHDFASDPAQWPDLAEN
ncbi:phosphatase PAP2 family protein [Oceaniglobus ichthyenteri]|uniref:phosphatase PAP2 family protein n=1 Tax=Oceaniglobus ichthyenteri TaxID=2136177 RepID=UPI0013DE0190|nr:phosphatase PAP2 family protein [Oceaniglobus ichthyenteri]